MVTIAFRRQLAFLEETPTDQYDQRSGIGVSQGDRKDTFGDVHLRIVEISMRVLVLHRITLCWLRSHQTPLVFKVLLLGRAPAAGTSSM
jgi:hypothetical protein